MQSKVRLTVVLPSYLEAENLRLLLPRLNATLSQTEKDSEILVVDTIKPLDETAEVCRINDARYINRISSNSFGDAVRTGIEEAQGDYVIFMDADGSHYPEFIPNLYRYRKEYDIIIASRYTDGGFTENNRFLIFMSRTVNTMYSLVLGLQCKDVSNSFKLYRADLLKNVALYCNNFDIIEELLFKIKQRNKMVRILEVPFSFKKRMFGDTKRNLMLFAISYLFTLLKLRFGK
jgi:dolichol-phosphate mannosyltransferase